MKFDSSGRQIKMLKYPDVLCIVRETSVVILQCLQFYRRFSEEITQRRWENIPTGQTFQVAKGPQVCAELLTYFCMSHVNLFSLKLLSACNLVSS